MKNLLIFLSLAITCLSLESTEHTLTKLQVIFRHGYRYPTKLTWTDDTCAQSYQRDPLKLGNLTKLGKSQMRLLGYSMRMRYNSFIGDDASKIQVNYSDCNRDKESAQLVYGALFKDFDNKTDLVVPLLNKTIEGELATNKAYFPSWLESIPWSKHLREQCRSLDQTGKITCKNREQFHKMSSQMVCELAEECALPSWLDAQIKENLLADFTEVYQSFQLCSSKKFILDNSDEMLKWMAEVFKPEKEDSYKNVHLYASHDTNIAIILTRMGVFNSLPVPFGAALTFEEHIIENKRIIRVFYDNTTNYSNYSRLKLPDCNYDCPYEKFVEIVTGKYPCSSTIHLRSEAFVIIIMIISSYVITGHL